MQTRRPCLAALTLTAALTSFGCADRPPHRYFQPTANQIGPELNSYGEAVVPRHGLIVVQGDDLAYGLARRRSRHAINGAQEGQASITISQTLRRALKGVDVQNRGYPGDTVQSSAARWRGLPPGDLLILCYGTGDLRANTPTSDFKAQLGAMISSAHAQGAAVFVVQPPGSADPIFDDAVNGYRDRAADAARDNGALVFDTTQAISRLKAPRVKGVAQPAAYYQAVAADMVAYIKVVAGPARATPQTGQAGSADSRPVRVSPASPS